MRATDLLKMSLEMSNTWIMSLAADMHDAPLTFPTTHGGNHPLWCVAHMAYSEAGLVHSMCQGKENPLADWAPLFDQGTTPVDDADKYPSFAEVQTKAEEVRTATLQYIESLSDEDLDKPSHAPEEMKPFFGTIGQCLTAISIHTGYHGGQIADCRRAAGRQPLMG